MSDVENGGNGEGNAAKAGRRPKEQLCVVLCKMRSKKYIVVHMIPNEILC
jgi:hypothetical protein